MSLFDFFRKKSAQQPNMEHIGRPERQTIIPVEVISEGGHGDHWAGLFSFNTVYNESERMDQVLNDLLVKGVNKKISAEYGKQELQYAHFDFKSIIVKNELKTAYPVLKTQTILPVTLREIKEWGHTGGIEGQVEAKGKNTFGLSFFATDYLENKSLYQNQINVNVKLTGFAYSVELPPHMEDMSEDFVGYMPNTEYKKLSVIDYVGKILELTEVHEPSTGVHGCIAKLRLIQMEEDKDFFVIDVFINSANLSVPNINVGDRISGMMWLQGQIVQSQN